MPGTSAHTPGPGLERVAARRPRTPPNSSTAQGNEGIPETAGLGPVSAKRAVWPHLAPDVLGSRLAALAKAAPIPERGGRVRHSQRVTHPGKPGVELLQPWPCAIVSRPAASQGLAVDQLQVLGRSAVSCGRVAVALCSGGSLRLSIRLLSAGRAARASELLARPGRWGSQGRWGAWSSSVARLAIPYARRCVHKPRRGGKIRARALPIHHIDGAPVRRAAHPGRPSSSSSSTAPASQRGGGVNATLRGGHGGFGPRDCGQDRVLEAPWGTGRGARPRSSCLSACL